MAVRGGGEVGGGAAAFEVALEVGEQRRPIAFDGEVIVSETAADELGDRALGQERIGGDVLILQVEPLEQGDRGFDLVALFDGVRIARYGQSGDFFWV